MRRKELDAAWAERLMRAFTRCYRQSIQRLFHITDVATLEAWVRDYEDTNDWHENGYMRHYEAVRAARATRATEEEEEIQYIHVGSDSEVELG